ncbi:MAG: UvrD-helicase domain-containing protein [Bryobacteraceae bacterium]|jgi:superfamily I DNA/RNA helicase/mRNA-degrading endonuclease RelE of RelBE toxin-antitoxin system
MEFRIADTFTDSLTKLTSDEQKAVKTTAFDLQLNPAHPSLQFHKLDKAKDRRFWSLRVSIDIRLIVHRTETSLLLCYVGHHDKAYQWAERRKLETHPKTGAAQLVEVRETFQEIAVPKYVDVLLPAAPKPALFARVADDVLLGYGVPVEWLADVRLSNEDTLLELADHLPGEAAEALLDLATGAAPKAAKPVAVGADPFAHPDAQRRFRTMANVEELERALEYPWDKWTVFLHPAQRALVERDYAGPARVAGSAGTGKTIVALHRAVFLVRANPVARVLLATFSDTLASALRQKLCALISNEPRLGERLEVHSMNAIGRRLYEVNLGRPRIASRETVRDLLREAAEVTKGHKFSGQFLLTEWEQVVDAWQLDSWELYRDVVRLGRKTRLQEAQRVVLWSIFERVRSALKQRGLVTESEVFSRVASKLRETGRSPFEFTVVDEAQDVSVPQLRFLAALGAGRLNGLFFAGDLGQRIFQQPFSWKALGVDIRGRSSTLRINYRTSHQIRSQADRLLGPEVSDVDGNREDRKGTVSTFNGPPPEIAVLETREKEIERAGQWLAARVKEGILPHEIGIFVRSEAELSRARAAAQFAKLRYKVLDEGVETITGQASVGTMHLAKGLEFRAVVVVACDDEVIPSQARIETVADDADLEDVYNTERHLLYVACTRARDRLLLTATAPASEFLDDLR